jgi:histidinol-phosphate aminotransferase
VSTTWERLANEPILDIQPYQPGKPIEELERELGITGPVKLASNEENARLLDALRVVLGKDGGRS